MRGGKGWLARRRFPIRLGTFLVSLMLAVGLFAAGKNDLPSVVWILLGLMALNQAVLLFV